MEEGLRFSTNKLSPEGQEELRKKIVREMKKRGEVKEVAEICECSVRHVYSTWKRYKEGGVEAVNAVKMGRPRGTGCRLSPRQEAIIKKLIASKNPSEVGLNGYLWERKTVVALVKQRFDIDMPLSTIGDYLARWDFTSQRPKKTL
jgi:transposase